MIQLHYWQGAIITYCLVTYLLGWHWFKGGFNATVGAVRFWSFVTWIFSPIVVPIGIVIIFLAG